MKANLYFALFCVFGIGLLGCEESMIGSGTEPVGWKTGTITYVQLEGGFYGIIGDDGMRYDPVDLPETFKKDGMRVRFQMEEMAEQFSFHMWGKLIRLKEIEQLEGSSQQVQ